MQDPEDEGMRSTSALAALARALAADARVLGRRLARLAAALARRLSAATAALGARSGSAGRSLRRRVEHARHARRERVAARPAAPETAEAAPAASPAPARRRRSPLRLALRVAAVAVLALFLAVASTLGWALWGMDFSAAARAGTEPTVIIETLDGDPFASKGGFRGAPVDPAALPQHLVDAVVAIEDRRFYRHPGLDVIGITRAAVTNLSSGGIVEGGSTITQQLARVLFLSQDRTFKRKVREAALALWLEATLEKEEILARYLGSIYMGAGAWGMPAAARIYFDKELGELSLAEAAMLAGLIKAPSDLNPRSDMAAARERADVVLEAMTATGAINEDQAMAARAAPAELHQASVSRASGGWFADWVYGEAADLAGSFTGTLYVRSTLHPRVQHLAEAAVAEVMDAEGAAANASQAALVAMLPDGAVLALVGGRDYDDSQFNRATDAKRQPGSTFKTFVYWAALQQGWSMDDPIDDAPVEVDGWKPQNYSGRYRGRVTLRQALAQSLNAATVRLALDVGIDQVAEAARSLGLDAELMPTPSLALGTSEVTLLDLTGAYASLVEGRAPVEPWGIINFGAEGTERYRLGPRTEATSALPEQRYDLIDALRVAVEAGTGKAARLDGFAAGKTGTTQDYRDAWFVGTNGPFVTGVWVGNDDNGPMDNVTGGKLPAQIWQRFMTDLMAMLEDGDPILQPAASAPAASTPAVRSGGTGGTGGTAGAALDDDELPFAPEDVYRGGKKEKKKHKTKRNKLKGRDTGRALACNVRACERAYRSFRRSDCTFQPYRGPRKLCVK